MEHFLQALGLKDVESLDMGSPYSWTYIVMLLISFFYGVILHQLYNLYFKENEPLDGSLSRSMILLTPALMTIFWVIHLSVPLSLGLIGTLSFVRFRSPVKRAEDVAFIVMCLACAIACAIVKPLMGAGLLLLFLSYALVRHYVTPASLNGNDFAVLTFNTRAKPSISELEDVFRKSKCRGYEFVSSRTYDGITSFVFNIANLKKTNVTDLTNTLEEIDKDSNINVFYPNGRLGS